MALIASGNLGHSLTIPASEDSSSSQNKLTTAGNRSGLLFVDANRKAYVSFALSEVPTSAVGRWAKLRLFLPLVRVKGSGVNVHTVTGEWTELTFRHGACVIHSALPPSHQHIAR
jgi:hypothetical protein